MNLYEGKIYIQTGKVKKVAHQLKANGKVEICGMSGGKWIRLQAVAVLDEDVKAQEAMLAAHPGLKDRYAIGDGNLEVYYLKNCIADIDSFKEGLKHYEF